MSENLNKENIREELLHTRKNGYDIVNTDDVLECIEYAEKYKTFLDHSKTEREAVNTCEITARAAGYEKYVSGRELKPGDKIYAINRDRAMILAHIGKESLSEGCTIIASHIDAPRIDLKPYPLYEDADMAYFKTHYYGGIRKYQWVTIPLELRGVIFKKDGERVSIDIGAKEEDPVLVITDLLPHLAKDHSQKTLSTAFTGEDLNVLIGSIPYNDDGKDRFKLSIMSLLNERFGITETDFISSELSLVPAGKSRDVGLDSSLIGAYGQDDRVCAYTSFSALLDVSDIPTRTAVCVLADKEEIGSEGVSGMQSSWFDSFFDDLCKSNDTNLAECFKNSICISADVGAAYDPNFSEVYEKRNSAFINNGVSIMKYTGSRGKSTASDASAELVFTLRDLFDKHNVLWQMGELGKVDQGGGGTVAKYMAKRDIDTIDAGVPVLSMHAPFEITAKLDVFMMYRASKAFYTL